MTATIQEKMKRHFWFTREEWQWFTFSCIAVGFFLAFRNWGSEGTPDIGYGLGITALTIAMVAVSLWAQLSFQRILSLVLGYKPVYEINFIVIMVSLMITVLTNGIIPPALAGWQRYSDIPRYRLGKWPPMYNTIPIAWVNASGLFLNLFLAVLGKIVSLGFQNTVLDKFIMVNLALAVFGILPLPFNPGIHVLYGSILTFIVSAVIIFSAAFLIFFTNQILLSILVPLILSVIAATYFIWKSKTYKG